MIERFRHYVLFDHRARWRNDTISVAISVAFYWASIAAGVPNAYAVQVSLGLLIVVATLLTVWYSAVSKSSVLPADVNFSKRAFLPRIVMATLVLASLRIGTPTLEAAIIEKRLRKLLQGNPSQEQIQEAAKIVSDANDNNLHASPRLISELGQKVLKSSANPGAPTLAAACVFASYRSSLSPRPPLGSQSVKGPLYVALNVTCSGQPKSGEPPYLYGVGWFAIPPGSNVFLACSRVLVRASNKQVPLLLDGIHAQSITFLDCTLSYNGGPLDLGSIQFINCTFVTAASGDNQNVRQFIEAVMTGQSIDYILQIEQGRTGRGIGLAAGRLPLQRNSDRV